MAFIVFGVFLFYTAIRLVLAHSRTPDILNNRVVLLTQRLLPVTTDYQRDGLLVRVDGRRMVTPLLLVVVAILSVDTLFVLDFIPAIFGITDSAYLVFTANVFAPLGLRALYFLIVGLLDRLVHLHYGLAVVLGFIGVKLVLHYVHSVNPDVPAISTEASLLVVVGVLGVTTFTSLRARHSAATTGAATKPEGQSAGPTKTTARQRVQARWSDTGRAPGWS